MAEAMALRALARREYARVELTRRLRASGVQPAHARAAVERLAGRGVQSDRRYAEMIVQARRRRGYGPLRVAAELRAAGVDDDVAAPAIEADAPAWAEACRAWYQRHGRARAGDPLRAERALRQRGFTPAQVRAALTEARG